MRSWKIGLNIKPKSKTMNYALRLASGRLHFYYVKKKIDEFNFAISCSRLYFCRCLLQHFDLNYNIFRPSLIKYNLNKYWNINHIKTFLCCNKKKKTKIGRTPHSSPNIKTKISVTFNLSSLRRGHTISIPIPRPRPIVI